MHRTVMLDPLVCCICRRRLRWAWLIRYPRYLGMRCHHGCHFRQLTSLDDLAPFKLIEGEGPADD